MEKKRLPKSVRKYIRKEKARLRREAADPAVLSEAMKKLSERFRINHPQTT